MKIQGIDGAIDTVQLSIVYSTVHMSIGVLKPVFFLFSGELSTSRQL